MCGFVGFSSLMNNKEATLEQMMNQIIHRGPDSDGKYMDEHVALGFRRLSIIDLEGGSQPIYNETGDIVLVFNGEIYNYQILREELIEKGHTFETHTDSEVLVHSYEEYGSDMLNRLRGMFAFIIWDKKKKMLFGARDYFGIKPLYYTKMKDTFMFGSEIKSFLEHPDFKKELNEEALEGYLSFQYSPMAETFFKGVYKLPPAHYFVYKDGQVYIERYWEPKFDTEEKTLDEYIDLIDETFKGSVETHKISDVEVGCFLSSGVDSSYVAATFNGDRTFTVGFDYDQYNEIGYAQELSKTIGIDNYHKVITTEEYWDSLSKIQYQLDEPLADPAGVALYFVSQLASQHVKVVLSGEGADELFGGYNIYKEPSALASYQKLPRWFRKFVGKVATWLPDVKGKSFLIRGSKTIEERFIGNANMFSVKDRKKILKHPTNAPTPQMLTKPFYDKVKDKDDETKMQYLDIHMWMAGDILLKADKMSMAHSLELRVPFLDKEVMALAGKIPTKYRINNKNTKYAMRMAAKRNIPEKVANKKKLGFPVPTRVWLREDQYYKVVKKAFKSEAAKKYFNTAELTKLLDQHYNGKKDNSRKVWTVYMFLLWYEQYFA
ncbi:asparagine synthase (glutamine-hydrolyzing) [Vallitalea okinawensis]|uniref:asparagine synthase (glutamine-hydrolyzing) n=1 Tax=Vallitalea okinawensis TaxID=2078660 RepID=UPI000CFB44CA|nr:asparagine synthase (glutamine-hydrolyzing) [Vallitalea okinawensis]